MKEATLNPVYSQTNLTLENQGYIPAKTILTLPPAYRKALSQLNKAYGARDGWDGDSAPQPLRQAYDITRLLLELVYDRQSEHILPVGASPIVDGGLGLVYKRGRQSIIIEVFNDTSIIYSLRKDGRLRSIESSASDEISILKLSQEVQNFLKRG